MQKKELLVGLSLIMLLLALSCTRTKQQSVTSRYIVTSPELAELITLIDGPNNIVGVTNECSYPVILQKKSKVGDFGQLSIEKIIALKPTYVFTTSLEQKAIADELKKLDIPSVQIYPRSIKEMMAGITELGRVLHKEKRASFVRDSLQAEINKLADLPKTKSKVFIEIYGDPLMTAADNSFIGEIIQLAGGINCFPRLERDYCRIDPERVVKADPDIIILTYPGVTKEQVMQRKGWQSIKAVKNQKIMSINEINPDWLLRAGPRFILGVKAIREKIDEK